MQLFFRRSVLLCGAFAIIAALIVPVAGAAQNDPNSDATSTAADGVGVARISLIEGSVAVQRGDSSDSLTAALNAPVLGGDYLTTGDAARAEVQLDGYSQVRLGQDVQMRFTHLDTNNRSVQLAAGTVDLRLLNGTDGSNTIDTPSITVKPQQGGSYRVTVTSDGQTLVTVRSGDAQIDTPQGQQDLQPGTTLIAQGEASNPSIQSVAATAYDDFDRFNADRDRAHAPAVAYSSYVNPNIGGVEDLNANGRWVTDGSYGHVWVPSSVGRDWAPYRDGRWVWEEGYGWTWIADESWGWAPYHYGSWYNSPNYGWCWYPPQPRVYVPWRPALVAFIGFGGGSGFSLSFGGGNAFANVGWVPLAPFEPYHPWWGNRYDRDGGRTVVNNITNITNVTNVTNINVYKNVRYNAVSSVSSQRFLQGNFTHNAAVTAPQLREAHVFRGALPVVPTASNLRFTKSSATPPVAFRPALMQRSFAGSGVVVHRTPFTTQRVALATVTHAAITPLHFRDAQTTPLLPQPAIVHAGPQPVHLNSAAPANATGHPVPQDVRMKAVPAHPVDHALPSDARANSLTAHPVDKAVPQDAPAKAVTAHSIDHAVLPDVHPNAAVPPHPATGAGAAAAWTRFNQTRSPGSVTPGANTPVESSVHHAPVSPDNLTQPGSTVGHAPAVKDYNPPGAPNTYHAPGAPNAYHAPAASDTYHAPSAPNTYHAPAAPNTYHAPPAPNTYDAPNTYHGPASDAYHAPVVPNTYHAPAPHPAHVTPPRIDTQSHQAESAAPAHVTHPPAQHNAPAPPSDKADKGKLAPAR